MYYGDKQDEPNMIGFDGKIYITGSTWPMCDYGCIADYINWCNPEDYILMQYTGCKDKNKNEVYEGDILQREGEWSIRIEFEKGIFFIRDLNRIRYINKITIIPMALFEIEEFEVVGNIYQNPELLEEE